VYTLPSLSTELAKVERTKEGNPAEAVSAVLLSCFFKILSRQPDSGSVAEKRRKALTFSRH
jgi:hypothetical protein